MAYSATPRPVEQRMAAFVSPEPNTGCWLWTGYVNHAGYGVVMRGKRRTALAHRVALELVSPPAAPDLFACHRCDQPGCVNPRHLFWGTGKDNQQDAVRKGRKPRGVDIRVSVLNPEKVAAMRAEYAAGGTSMAKIAKKYGIGVATSFQVLTRETWKEVA